KRAEEFGCDDMEQVGEALHLCLALQQATMPADVCLAMTLNADDGAIERHGRYEQRMQRTIHRCLMELRQHRKEQGKTLGDLPESPFLDDSPIPPDPEPEEPDDETEDEPDDDSDDSDENEPTDPAAGGSDTPVRD